MGIGFKVVLRTDDLRRCKWGRDYCEAFPTRVRLYLDGRKNNQYGGNFLDIARPLGGVVGAYHVVLLAHTVFSSGYVLPRVAAEGTTGFQRAMSHKNFV